MSKPSDTNCSKGFFQHAIFKNLMFFSSNMFFMKLKTHGGYCIGDHLFPYRTEKLSPIAQMVLPYKVGEYVAASFPKSFDSQESELFFFIPICISAWYAPLCMIFV